MFEELTAFSTTSLKRDQDLAGPKLRVIFQEKSWNSSLRFSLLAEVSVLPPNEGEKGNPGQQEAEEAQQLLLPWEMFLGHQSRLCCSPQAAQAPWKITWI